jgi:hypothetical protein
MPLFSFRGFTCIHSEGRSEQKSPDFDNNRAQINPFFSTESGKMYLDHIILGLFER